MFSNESSLHSHSEWENATDTPIRESLPTPPQLYKHGLEHLNISIDYWQRALTMIDLSLANSSSVLDPIDATSSHERLTELKQKIEFLLNKIDVSGNATELALLLQQEKEQLTASSIESLPLTNSSFDQSLVILNRRDSNRVQQELQTALSVQSDLNTFNDRRSLRSMRSTDSFQSCPDVGISSTSSMPSSSIRCSPSSRMRNGSIRATLCLIHPRRTTRCPATTCTDCD